MLGILIISYRDNDHNWKMLGILIISYRTTITTKITTLTTSIAIPTNQSNKI